MSDAQTIKLWKRVARIFEEESSVVLGMKANLMVALRSTDTVALDLVRLKLFPNLSILGAVTLANGRKRAMIRIGKEDDIIRFCHGILPYVTEAEPLVGVMLEYLEIYDADPASVDRAVTLLIDVGVELENLREDIPRRRSRS